MRSSCLMVCKGHPCPLPLSETLACWAWAHLSRGDVSGRPVKWFVKIVRKEPAKGLGQSACKAEQSQLSGTGMSPLPPREGSSYQKLQLKGTPEPLNTCLKVAQQLGTRLCHLGLTASASEGSLWEAEPPGSFPYQDADPAFQQAPCVTHRQWKLRSPTC